MDNGICLDHGRAGDKDGYTSTEMHPFKDTCVKFKLHRLIYCLVHNVNPETIVGKVVMHTCDNPRCINPFHLKLGTCLDNNADRVHKGRYCGVSAYRAKLTQADVDFIRANYVKRGKVWNTYTLAKKYGVTHGTIGNIVRGQSYKEQGNASF